MDSMDIDDMYEFPSGGGYDMYPSQAETVDDNESVVVIPSAATTNPLHPHGSGHHVLHRRRSVYDAVAGRIRLRQPRPPKWSGQAVKYRNTKLAPEEVLFRGAKAPARFEETDPYFAHEDLADDVLPPSDLVKAIHHYAGHYYEALARRQGLLGAADEEVEREQRSRAQENQKPKRLVDERSMDETALLAFGVLLEEAAREMLGVKGALVLTEPVDEDENGDEDEQDGKEDEAGGEIAKV
ncbi:hypothetical protein SEPCBS57363_004867 [Sporothrix epigloea]|uniref:Uncharacterized protein n=1 Tax=Sporothrix epigloea TaxID=1892477 RepID=A0ABP0DUF4_9PEZI